MARAIFSDSVASFDSKMGRQGRCASLWLDNSSAHHVPDAELTNLELKYYPPGCTFVIQPLDRGVIRSLKCAYCQREMNLENGWDTKLNSCIALPIMAAARTAA